MPAEFYSKIQGLKEKTPRFFFKNTLVSTLDETVPSNGNYNINYLKFV